MTGLLITARMGSSRLPQKHLVVANGKPMIWWLVKRFEHIFEQEIAAGKVKLVVATSEKPGNEKFVDALVGTTCEVFMGSDNNIPLRHLQCAHKYGFDHIISIDGDDILCSAEAARVIWEQMNKQGPYDYFSVSGLPLGMNLAGYTVDYLERSLNGKGTGKMETGWGRIFKEPRTWNFPMGNYDIMGDLRFTLDYEEDADFFAAVINGLKDKVIAVTDKELIGFVEGHKLYQINTGLKEVYWENYNSEKKKEDEQ